MGSQHQIPGLYVFLWNNRLIAVVCSSYFSFLFLLLHLFHDPRNDAEEFGVGVGGDGNRGVGRVFGEESDGFTDEFKAFDGELAV